MQLARYPRVMLAFHTGNWSSLVFELDAPFLSIHTDNPNSTFRTFSLLLPNLFHPICALAKDKILLNSPSASSRCSLLPLPTIEESPLYLDQTQQQEVLLDVKP
jgi:hypothetical protein